MKTPTTKKDMKFSHNIDLVFASLSRLELELTKADIMVMDETKTGAKRRHVESCARKLLSTLQRAGYNL